MPEVYLRPGQVAALFGVDPKTVGQWANAGRLTVVRTVGGHRRYLESEVLAIKGKGSSDEAAQLATEPH